MIMKLHDFAWDKRRKGLYLIFFKCISLNSGIVSFTVKEKAPGALFVLNFELLSRL